MKRLHSGYCRSRLARVATKTQIRKQRSELGEEQTDYSQTDALVNRGAVIRADSDGAEEVLTLTLIYYV